MAEPQMLHDLGELLDGIDIALCVFNDDDQALAWNRTFLRIFPEHDGHIFEGEPYRANLRRFYGARLGEEEMPRIESYIDAGIARHMSQNRPYAFEHRGQWVQVASLPLAGVGRARAWRAAARPDNAALAGLSTATREALEHDTQLLDQVPNGLMICGQDGRIEWVNDAFVLMYGMANRNTAVGSTFETVFRLAWSGVEGGQRESFDLGCKTLQENLRFSGAPFELPLPNQRHCRVIARSTAAGEAFYAHVDISELKRQQKQLAIAERLARESEAELKRKSVWLGATLDNMEQGVVMVGADGIVEVFNRRALELLNLPPAWLGTRPRLLDVIAHQERQGDFDQASEALKAYARAGRLSEQLLSSYEHETSKGRILDVRSVSIQGDGILRTVTDITQQKHDVERIRHAANHDGLTGLLNRGMFNEYLAAEVFQARRTGTGCAIMYIDLDGFKLINDSHGHAMGDKVLVWFAHALQRVAREADAVARLGGDEFAVLLRGVQSREPAQALALRVAQVLEQPILLESRALRLGASIGIALYPQDGDEPGQLLNHADLAMYGAKAQRKKDAATPD